MKRGWSVAALGALVICVAGCGSGSSNGRLSSPEYKQELAKISKQSDAAHGAVEQSAPSANEVSKLKAPQNAEAAVLPKLARFKSVQQAFGYLQQLGSMKGGREQDQAISQLKKLGHTSGS